MNFTVPLIHGGIMTDLKLRVRYFQDSTPADVPCREENFIRREIDMAVPLEQTALVLVDLWNIHFIESWLERAISVTKERIVPAIQAARNAGMTVIHCPSPEVAAQFPQTSRNPAVTAVAPDPDAPQWPPDAFRKREDEFAAYAGPRSQPPGIGVHWGEMEDQLSMSSAVKVLDDDIVISSGPQLHRVLADRGIMHLVYAGFATNWCVLGRDYGIRAMARYGYNIIMLRDCTAGVEFPDTLEDLLVTEIALREIEQQFGFTASNDDFFTSCGNIS